MSTTYRQPKGRREREKKKKKKRKRWSGVEGRGISGTGWTFGCGTKPVFFFSLIWSSHNRHSEYSANYYALSHNICVCSMSPAVKAFSLVSLKGRNGIFNVCNGLSECCTHTKATTQALPDKSAQLLTRKKGKKVLHPFASRSRTLASGFTVQCFSHSSTNSRHVSLPFFAPE